jgi:Transposase, Mutator family
MIGGDSVKHPQLHAVHLKTGPGLVEQGRIEAAHVVCRSCVPVARDRNVQGLRQPLHGDLGCRARSSAADHHVQVPDRVQDGDPASARGGPGQETTQVPDPTAPDSLPFAALLEENLASAGPDLLRQMANAFADAMMSADVDAACGASYGMPSEERVNSRNGYRHRQWDTRAGSIDLAIPKIRSGSYFPD